MLLASELKGYIPAASQYFTDDSENTRNSLDLLMLTHGWTAYDWSMLAGTDSTFSIKHPIENSIQLNGYFMKKEKVKKWGQMGSFKIIPLKGIKVYFDIAYDGNGVTNYEFTTEKNGKFQLELEDFYGKRYTALTPILTGKQIQDTIFKFSMNKYFSPKFRLYDYWQWNRGYRPGNKKAGNMQAIDIFGRNKLEEVDVTAKKHIGPTNRPPRSEIRLDFMDEWEYAQDVSYVHTPQDNWMMNKVSDTGDIYEDIDLSEEKENKLYTKYDFLSESNYISEQYNFMALTTSTDNWRVYGWEGPRHHAYENVLTAYEVLQSAFWRHNYNWAYWVKMIVPQGEYSSDAIPIEDKEYIKGKDPIKMMNFKEIVIRSDEPTLQQFKNEGWYNQRTAFLNKGKFRSFYFGFLLRSSITPQDDKLIDEYPGNATFRNRMARKNLKKIKVNARGEESNPNNTRKNVAGNDVIDIETVVKSYNTDLIFQQKMYPEHPNFVACFIPNKGKDKVSEGLVPDIAVKSVRRYTCIQGYNRSKKFYSPNYSRNKPDKNTKDYRRTLFWIPNAEVGNDGCITFKLYNNSKESVLLLDVAGMKEGNFYAIE